MVCRVAAWRQWKQGDTCSAMTSVGYNSRSFCEPQSVSAWMKKQRATCGEVLGHARTNMSGKLRLRIAVEPFSTARRLRSLVRTNSGRCPLSNTNVPGRYTFVIRNGIVIRNRMFCRCERLCGTVNPFADAKLDSRVRRFDGKREYMQPHPRG